MNKIFMTLSLLMLSTSFLVFADDTSQVITLKDGSQIKGVLSGINNGVYTVKTPIIGDIQVAASDVANISSGNAAAAPALVPTNNTATPTASAQASGNAALDQQIAASQQQLMSNPQSMQLLQQMTQDPQIMQALQDPALVQCVTNHDYQCVQNSPILKQLMGNAKMQAIVQQLAAQQPQQAQQQQNTASQ